MNIPIIDYSDRSIDEMQIVDDEESIYLLVNVKVCQKKLLLSMWYSVTLEIKETIWPSTDN